MKLSVRTISLLALWVVLVGFVTWQLGSRAYARLAQSISGVEAVEMTRVPSPDGRFEAVLSQLSHGAFSSFDYEVNVVQKGGRGDVGSAVFLCTHLGMKDLSLNWQGGKLTIGIPLDIEEIRANPSVDVGNTTIPVSYLRESGPVLPASYTGATSLALPIPPKIQVNRWLFPFTLGDREGVAMVSYQPQIKEPHFGPVTLQVCWSDGTKTQPLVVDPASYGPTVHVLRRWRGGIDLVVINSDNDQSISYLYRVTASGAAYLEDFSTKGHFEFRKGGLSEFIDFEKAKEWGNTLPPPSSLKSTNPMMEYRWRFDPKSGGYEPTFSRMVSR